MQSRIISLGAGVVSALLLFVGATLAADEEKVALEKVPAPVLAAVKARFPEAQPTGATIETDDGKQVYEVSFTSKGQKIDMILTSAGKIILFEAEIPAKALPAAPAKSLKAKYPNATYKRYEKIVKVENQKEKLANYEVLLVTADKKELAVQVAPDGTIGEIEEK